MPPIVADVEPKVVPESRSPQTLIALAEDGHGVAIIPSVLNTDRYDLRIVQVTHRLKPVRERYAIQWNRRRPLPPYANQFFAALADYMREVMPITRPVEAQAVRKGGPKRAAGRKHRAG